MNNKQYFIMCVENEDFWKEDYFVVVSPDENLLLKRVSEFKWPTFEKALFELYCIQFADVCKNNLEKV